MTINYYRSDKTLHNIFFFIRGSDAKDMNVIKLAYMFLLYDAIILFKGARSLDFVLPAWDRKVDAYKLSYTLRLTRHTNI